MSIGAAQTGLESDLEDANVAARDSGTDGNDTTASLAKDVATAVHDYFVQALVTTTVTVDENQPDTIGGSSDASPPDGTGTGGLS